MAVTRPQGVDAARLWTGSRRRGGYNEGTSDLGRANSRVCIRSPRGARHGPSREGGDIVRHQVPWPTGRGRSTERPRVHSRGLLKGVLMAVVTMRQLLESGVHFGHQTRRWNPKMKRYILTERNGIYIIDLTQSLSYIDKAYEFIRETVAHGGSIMFVGTKKQAQEAVAEQATRVGMPYVNERWLGGMLTNFQTVAKRIQRLKELEQLDFTDVAGSGLTKKELLVLRREKDKLERTLGGIREMGKVPSALWVVDTKKEHIAVAEARKLGLPVVAILDTNCDPDEVDFAIPGNDDAIRATGLLTRVIADAVADGLMARAAGKSGTTDAEPLADWETELLAGSLAADVAEADAVAAANLVDSDPVAAAELAAEATEAVALAEAAEEAVVAEVAAEIVAEAEVPEA